MEEAIDYAATVLDDCGWIGIKYTSELPSAYVVLQLAENRASYLRSYFGGDIKKVRDVCLLEFKNRHARRFLSYIARKLEKKRKEAELVMEFMDLVISQQPDNYAKKLTAEQRAARFEYVEKMKALQSVV